MIGDGIRMQVHVGELGENQIETVRLIQLRDLLLELEVLENLSLPLGKALDVVTSSVPPCPGHP